MGMEIYTYKYIEREKDKEMKKWENINPNDKNIKCIFMTFMNMFLIY